jgi:hypothetical protein
LALNLLRFRLELGQLGFRQRCERLGHGYVFLELSHVVAAHDHRANRQRQHILQSVFHGEGSGPRGSSLKGRLLIQRRRRPGGEDLSPRRDLHADDAQLLLESQRQQIVDEAQVVPVGGVDGHQPGREDWRDR